jgi:hypothetical protein
VSYLPASLASLQERCEGSSPSDVLLYSLARYLSIPPPTGGTDHSPERVERLERTISLSAELSAAVRRHREDTLLQCPASLRTVQALDMLATFCPLSVLPGQPAQQDRHQQASSSFPAPSRSSVAIGRARGQLILAKSIAQAIDLHAEAQNDLSYLTSSRTPDRAWNSEAVWTWIHLQFFEATANLEADIIAPPPLLAEAASVAKGLSLQARLHSDDHAILAKIAVCESIQRLAVVFDALGKFDDALMIAAGHSDGGIGGPTDPVEAIVQARQAAVDGLEELTDRFDELSCE